MLIQCPYRTELDAKGIGECSLIPIVAQLSVPAMRVADSACLRCLREGQATPERPTQIVAQLAKVSQIEATWKGRDVPVVTDEGPGTELKKLLEEIGLGLNKTRCNCEKHVKQMNEWGVEICKARRSEIVAWLDESRSETGLFAQTRAYATALAKGLEISLLDPVGSLLDIAIKRATPERPPVRAEKPVIFVPERPSPRRSAPLREISWAYGVTTVPERLRDGVFERTLTSLREAGYDAPRLFVDDCPDAAPYRRFGLEATTRYPRIRTFGNWALSLGELWIRYPQADRYAIFQDDFVTYKHLREYLSKVPYPDKGYLNLYTFPPSHQLPYPPETGFYKSNQLGKGAVALVFNNDAVRTLLTHIHFVDRPKSVRGWKSIDGGIGSAMKKAGWEEYVHNPSLTFHIGERSAMGNHRHPPVIGFRGESFDARELLK